MGILNWNTFFFGVDNMGRKRLPEQDRREFVGIRLPKWMVDKIREKGKIQEVIESILMRIFRKE